MAKPYLHKETVLHGRYITNDHIEELHLKHQDLFNIISEGKSVERRNIYSYTIGSGAKRILVWSQMHGNESTTTKAVYDFFNWLRVAAIEQETILTNCTLCFIPILNPDGAARYTRFNANQVDLNRDAQKLSQPESKVLRTVYDRFEPDFCFNLHGQRTIFSAGFSANTSIVSFLSPAENNQRAVTTTRKKAMEVINAMVTMLNSDIEGFVSRYNDAFNINCVGDTFMSLQTPTILFEAGHSPNDYEREVTRKYIYEAIKSAVNYIAVETITGVSYEPYFELPENQKLFYDVLIKNVLDGNNELIDVAIQYDEKLLEGGIVFAPKVVKIGDLTEFFGHKELEGNGYPIQVNKKRVYADGLMNVEGIQINGEDFIKKILIS